MVRGNGSRVGGPTNSPSDVGFTPPGQVDPPFPAAETPAAGCGNLIRSRGGAQFDAKKNPCISSAVDRCPTDDALDRTGHPASTAPSVGAQPSHVAQRSEEH